MRAGLRIRWSDDVLSASRGRLKSRVHAAAGASGGSSPPCGFPRATCVAAALTQV